MFEKPMPEITPEEVLMNQDLSVGAKAVYLYLIYFGEMDPSVKMMCRHLNITTPTLMKYLGELEKMNLVRIEKDKKSNHFVLVQ